MKKLLSLLTLLLCVASGAWAQTTLFLWQSDGSTTAKETVFNTTGGTAAFYGSANPSTESVAYNAEVTDNDLKATGSKGHKLGTNTLYLKVTLSENTLQAGDIIYICGYNPYRVGTGQTSNRANTDLAESLSTGTSKTDYNVGSITVPNTIGNNVTEIYLSRAEGTGTGLAAVKIVRPTVDTRTVVTLSFPQVSYNVNLGETFTAPVLTVDPTTAASEVTFSSSNTNVATVAGDGTVTLKAGGTTIITAAITGSTTYKDASASYTLTVTDPNVQFVTATFPFDSGAEGQTANVDVDNVFSATSVSVADMTYAGVGSDQGVTGTKMQPVNSASDDKSQYVKFIVIPKKGLTFTPTKIEFDALRWGTDGSNKLHYYAESGSTSQELGNVNPNRNSKGNGWSHYEHNISGINATKDAPFSLACYVYGLANNKQISFANIVITGTYSGVAEDETMYTVTTSVTPDGAGSISQTPSGESIAEGTAVTFSATANTGYTFLNKWTVNGNEENGATYSIASLAENTTVVAQFKQLFSIDYDKSASDLLVGTCGEVLKTEYADVNDKFTAPNNLYTTKAGCTFTGWLDGDGNAYTPGTEYTLTKNITLTPQFAENTVSLAKSLAATTVTWNFGSAYAKFNSEGNTMYYVQQTTINGEHYDVVMFCDQTSGKLNNVSRNDEWAQANGGTTFTIPAISGMKVVAKGYKQFSSTTIAGSTEYEATTKSPYTATYTYTGSDATIDIVIGNDISYLSSIAVTYPKTHTYVDVTSVGYRTFASSSALDFTNGVEGLTAYRAEVANKLVSFKAIDCPVPAEEGMLIKANEGRYYIPLATGAPVAIENELVGVTSATEIPAGSFVLMAATDNNQGTGFYKTASAFTVGANTAYLPSNVAGARTFIGFDFEDNTTTGVESSQFTVHSSQLVYNLNGQRVDNPKKGLYIVNGKKVIK